MLKSSGQARRKSRTSESFAIVKHLKRFSINVRKGNSMSESGLAFIISHIDVEEYSPIEFIPEHTFRAATDSEIERIKNQIESSVPRNLFSRIPYDSYYRKETKEDITNYHLEPLPRGKWKYWVIAFNGYNDKISQIEQIALLLPVEFEVGFTFIYSDLNQMGRNGGTLSMPNIVERHNSIGNVYNEAKILQKKDINMIGELFLLHSNMVSEFDFVKVCMRNFYNLQAVPKKSDLVIVGLFSIIESLITHKPRLTETLDSISHQVINKIILLRKKFTRDIVPNSYFESATEDKIWKRLYQYRSDVAHGTPVNFNSELKILRNRETVVNFLRENIKEIIILALKDPEFIFDLRKC